MKKHTEFVKGMRMTRKRFARGVAVAAGFIFLCTAPESARGQSNTPSPESTPPKPAPVARTQRVPSKGDDFAGLKYTDEQKEKIQEIHQNFKSRMDVVVKDKKLTADQRGAMLEGYVRMERGQVYNVLTPEQQKEVRERIRARRVAEQEAKKPSPPKK
jgi:Spy/CpxP family protein refolding chaperone